MSWASIVRGASSNNNAAPSPVDTSAPKTTKDSGKPPLTPPVAPVAAAVQKGTPPSAAAAGTPPVVAVQSSGKSNSKKNSPTAKAAAQHQTKGTASGQQQQQQQHRHHHHKNTPPHHHHTENVSALVNFTLTPVQPAATGATSLRPAPLVMQRHDVVLPPSVMSSQRDAKTAMMSDASSAVANSASNNSNRNSPEITAAAAHHASMLTTVHGPKLRYHRQQLVDCRQHFLPSVMMTATTPTTAITTQTIQSVLKTCPELVCDAALVVLERAEKREAQFSFDCNTCGVFNLQDGSALRPAPAGACEQMSELIKNTLKAARAERGLTFLCQSPEVVFAQLRLALAFDPKKTSKKMKNLPSRAVDLVRSFLCGTGFHFTCPPTTDNATWTKFSHALNFHLIMENQTPLFAELGKYWKKTHTPFEKFAHLLFWRDETPLPNTKNIISHYQMPVLVALCASATADIDSVVLLLHLGFFVFADEVLWSLPFMQNLIDVSPIKSSVLRHLCRYFYRKQTEKILLVQ